MLAADPHVAEEAAQLIAAEYEELPAVFDEVEALTSQTLRARRAQAGRHLRRSQAPQGPQGHQHRARLPAAPRRRRQRPSRRPRTCSSTRSAPRRCCTSPLEPFVSIADCKDDRRHASTPPRRARRSCAPRSRACSAGRRTRCACKVPYLGGGFGAKLYIKLEALVAALVDDRAPAGEGRAHHGGAVLHDHQARRRRSASRAASTRTAGSSRASARCAGTAAPMPTSARASRRSRASPRPGPTTSTTSAIDSYALYTNLPPAGALRGFGMPQLVWAYESHTDMIARALKHRPGRVPPQEPPARGPAAGHRHRS